MKKRRWQKGQSVPDYALVLGVVTLVATAGLTSMGGEINDFFTRINTSLSGLFAEAPSHNPSPEDKGTPTTRTSNMIPAWASAALAMLPPAPPGTQPVCFDHTCINLPVVDDTNDTVDTVGGNGVEKIHAFSDALAQLAQQLAQDPNSDPTLTQLISDVANRGHGIGDAQKVTLGAGRGVFIQTGTYSYAWINNTYAPEPLSPSKRDFRTALDNLNRYLSDYPNSLGETAQSVVQSNSSNILNFADSASTFDNGVSFQINPNPGKLVHQSANNICDQGGKDCYVPVDQTSLAATGQTH